MKKILCLVAIIVLMGCASAGQYFTIDSANKIKNGMTRDEVVAIMGTKPYQITDQGKTFVWSYAQVGATGRMESRAVKFSFDEKGKTYGVPDDGAYGDTQKYLDK
jgi:outer membrane protein assembly factor BamE (lipoprotein component of BamABCDE complex)